MAASSFCPASTIGYWRFENASSLGEDSGPNGLTLTNANSVASIATPFPAIIPGTSQGNTLAGQFTSGSSRYLWTDDKELFEFSDFTVEAYIKPASFGSGSAARTIVSQLNTGTGASIAWQFGVTGTSSSLGATRPFIQMSGNGTDLVSYSPGAAFTLEAGKLYYVAATVRFTGTGIETKFYLKNLTDASATFQSGNGTFSGSTAVPTAIFNSTARFAIGASYASGVSSRHFDGVIDEVRLSNSALAVSELLAGEDAGTPPVTTLKTEILNYKSSVTSDAGGLLDLTAELNYDSARSNAPVMVLMHPFSGATGHFDAYRPNAMRMRDAGFFVISPAMRGREGSDGVRDNGGVEIHDIYDAVEALKIAHPALIDATNISIIGYSGGGGNVMSALTKFPDYFRVGAAYYGMSDYGYHPTESWYFKGAAGRVSTLNASPGNPTPPSTSLIMDSYQARASNLASKNNPYSEIHLYVNDDETTCPKINVTSYKDNAVAAAEFAGEFNNITAHIGLPGVYQDFNGNSINDANELQYWPHANPSINQEQAGDLWYRARLLAGTIPQPALKTQDQLFVPGYVKTKRFGFWLGDGQNAAGNLTYSLSQPTKQFTFAKASILATSGTLTVDTSDSVGATIQVTRNGTVIDTFTGGGQRSVSNVVDGDVIVFSASGTVTTPYETWRTEKFGAGSPPLSGPLDDHDKDGLPNLAEFAMKLDPKAADAVSLRPGAAIVEETPGGNRLLEFKFRQRKSGVGVTGVSYAAEGVGYVIQTSTDLTTQGWSEGASLFNVIGSPVDNGDGTETVTIRLTGPVSSGKRFVRLKFTLAQ
ncbi:MAG TPA: LamG-like jellyroll fold domain-containing protein [Luteolibacter sp.]|nr:LamG-like jellyroll fold domain-containing protein [Luteolibacter sp.]